MQVKDKSVVTFHYSLTDNDGTVLDSSKGRDAFAYLQGAGMIVPGLEEQMVGKKAGDKFTAVVSPEKGYGLKQTDRVVELPKDKFGDQEVQVGMQFQAAIDGQQHMFTVLEVKENTVMLDGNHPLAGVTLNFDVEVTEVRKAGKEELDHGHVHGQGGHQH